MLMKLARYCSTSPPRAGGANSADLQRVAVALAIARWENEGGAPGRPESDEDDRWFVKQRSAAA